MTEYFNDFWLVTTDGRKLFPAKIKDRDSGRLAFRTLAKGSNLKADGKEFDEAPAAIEAFLKGASLRFGAPGHTANRFDLKGPKTAKVDATQGFRAAHPHLRF